MAVEVANPLRSMVEMLRAGIIALPVGDGADFAMGIVPPLTITHAQMRAVVDALAAAESNGCAGNANTRARRAP